MELLIAGSIALMGYGMSSAAPPRKPARRKKYAKQLGPANEYGAKGNDTAALTKRHLALAKQRFEQARDPAVTGIVSPHSRLTALMPFFTSAKKQNTSDAVKQTRLETFTGLNGMDSSVTGTYRPKREVEAMFQPDMSAVQVTSGGTAGNPAYGRVDDRLSPGVLQNNVVPAEQIRVGPGVGVGPDVAATDGFHPMHRILPKNVGEYKKNNLPGDVNHGKSLISKTASDGGIPCVSINRNPGALVWDLKTRPAMPTKAAVLAATNDADPGQTLKKPRVVDDSGRVGNPSSAGHDVRWATEDRLGYEAGRDHPDRNHALPWLNLAASGTGAFTHSKFDASRFSSQQREAPGGNGFLTAPTARAAPQSFVLSPTQRGLNSAGGYVGGAGSGANTRGQALHHEFDAKRTLRESQNASAVFGTVAAVKGGTLDNVWRFKRLDKEAKKCRGRNSKEEWRALPARINVVTGSAPVAVSRSDSKDVTGVAAMPDVRNKQYNAGLGTHAALLNKLPSENPRQDFSIAVDQLCSNPYAKSLWTHM